MYEQFDVEVEGRVAVFTFRGLTIVVRPDEDVPSLLTPVGDVPDMLRQRWGDFDEFALALELYLQQRPVKAHYH